MPKYMFLFHDQNAEKKRANRTFENVSQFMCLGMTVTNQNLIQEEIRRKLNSGSSCYHSVQNILSSLLLSKRNLNNRIYKITGFVHICRLSRILKIDRKHNFSETDPVCGMLCIVVI
jgi:hypothetical protein